MKRPPRSLSLASATLTGAAGLAGAKQCFANSRLDPTRGGAQWLRAAGRH